MLPKSISTLLMIVFITSLALAGSGPAMQEGLWEITTTTEMPGMPVNIPPVKSTQCLSKKNFVPRKNTQGQECKISNTQIKGNTVSWVVQCTSKGSTMDGTGTITYQDTTCEGTIKMNMQNPGQQKMTINSRISGRYVGVCQ